MTMTATDWLMAGNQATASGDLATTVYAIRRALALDPSDPAVHQALITNLDILPGASDALKRRARLDFDRCFVLPIMADAVRAYPNDPDQDRRLRVGYVSSDLFACSAAFCHGALILGSDHRTVEIYVYHSLSSRAEPGDPVTPVFEASSDVWRDVTGWDNAAIAEQIRRDRIDVLVDLGGYSSGSRMLVFAHCPAPIQITGWGHATGTDLSCFDYTVADAVTVPPEDEHRHREAILRVPSTIIYVPSRPGPGPASHPITYAPDRHVRFGNLGRAEKLTPECLATWADVLHAVPGSTLTLKCEAYLHAERRARVLIPLGAHGIASDRVVFHGETTNAAHLAVYNEIDVHLDAFPHTGGVTTMDAAWMGVPTVTLKGSAISHRISASILTTLGHQSRIAQTTDEYREIAVRLAHIVQTPEYRLVARDQMRRSVLVDQLAYATSVEAGYRIAWRRYVQSLGVTAELAAV